MPSLRKLLDQTAYLFSGLTGRWQGSSVCPSCQSPVARTVDRKYFHSLKECQQCGLVFRYPTESAPSMTAFYQQAYAEPGITTELPDRTTLKHLLETGFKGSSKDFSHHLEVLKSLGLKASSRLLDYGANWGYMTWQFQQAGVDVTAFEISQPRAAFGRELGLTIHTSLDTVGSGFDMVYSCHVLEHVPNPAETLQQQFDLVRPGGLVVAHTPNGSALYRHHHPTQFHLTWGKVHPVLLTDTFVARIAGNRPFFIASDDHLSTLAEWDQQSQQIHDTSSGGFFFAIRC